MCWHKDIAKIQILMKIVLNQCLCIQYERRVANLHFLSIINGNLIDLNMTLLTKKVIFYYFYIVKFYKLIQNVHITVDFQHTVYIV
jgi:hypothetical protein